MCRCATLYRDPHWSTGLSSQGPVEEQKEEEDEQGNQESKRLEHPLRQCVCSNGSSPNPAGPGLNEPAIKRNFLNVADNGGLTEKPLIKALGLASTACTGLLGS